MNHRTLLFSIQPYWAEKIFQGSKTIELRRKKPRFIEAGQNIFFYVSSPVKSLVGSVIVDGVLDLPKEELWEVVKENASITREEFENYFQGTENGIGIILKEVKEFRSPLKLNRIRELYIDFNPPQSFCYLEDSKVSELSKSLC
jgi:predicted transcriptional regulator